MIVLFRPRYIADRDMQRVSRAWTKAGSGVGEPVMQVPWDDWRREWDRVNTQNGRFVLFVRPEFIPSPAILDELDVYREEGQLVVALQKYNAAFHFGNDRPYEWQPAGISSAFMCFQLTGQTRHVLPPHSEVDPWEWLVRPRAWVYRVSQRYAPEGRSVSCLGTVYPGVWGGSEAVIGRLSSGGVRLTSKRVLWQQWSDALDGWNLWLRR